MSVSAIGIYVTPSYELGVANKMARFGLVIITGLFGLVGFLIATTIYILLLVRLKSIRTPYMWPLLPFNPMAMIEILFRVPMPYSNRRPSFVHPKTITGNRQPLNSERTYAAGTGRKNIPLRFILSPFHFSLSCDKVFLHFTVQNVSDYDARFMVYDDICC